MPRTHLPRHDSHLFNDKSRKIIIILITLATLNSTLSQINKTNKVSEINESVFPMPFKSGYVGITDKPELNKTFYLLTPAKNKNPKAPLVI